MSQAKIIILGEKQRIKTHNYAIKHLLGDKKFKSKVELREEKRPWGSDVYVERAAEPVATGLHDLGEFLLVEPSAVIFLKNIAINTKYREYYNSIFAIFVIE